MTAEVPEIAFVTYLLRRFIQRRGYYRHLGLVVPAIFIFAAWLYATFIRRSGRRKHARKQTTGKIEKKQKNKINKINE